MALADQHALESVGEGDHRRRQEGKPACHPGGLRRLGEDEGWGENLELQLGYGDEIAGIAIRADQRWKEQALLFVGKGFRDTAIEFFSTDSLNIARAWLRG